MMKIMVVDGQGGGIGKSIIEKLRQVYKKEVEIIALGTNALATLSMVKAGADIGATGENAIVFNVRKADVIMGTIGIVVANALHGELSPKMSEAIGSSDAQKILIPINRCSILVAGMKDNMLNEYIDEAVCMIKKVKSCN